jgi:hypothetical protein
MGLTKNSRDLCQHPGGSRNSDAPLGIGRTGVSPERLHDFGLLEMVEAIIHLDYPLSICLYRATRRTIENFLKWEFREAGWLAKIPRRVARYPQEIGEIFRYQYEPSKQPATSSDRIVITLKSPLELERLLAAIKRKLRGNTIA